jgi:hypothetical protein
MVFQVEIGEMYLIYGQGVGLSEEKQLSRDLMEEKRISEKECSRQSSLDIVHT